MGEPEGVIDYASVFKEKEMDDAKVKDIGEKFNNMLKVITEDARQLSEFLVAEGGLITEICTSLGRILSELDLSVALPKTIAAEMEKSKEVILNSQCHLIVVQKDGTVESKSLERYPPEAILLVVWALIPRLREEVSLYMKRVSVRLNFLEMINDELKNIQRPFEAHEGKGVGEFQEDKVKRVLLPQE